MQDLVTLVPVYIYIYISTILQNKEEKINLINEVRVGVNSTLKNTYINKKGRHSARKLACVFLFSFKYKK